MSNILVQLHIVCLIFLIYPDTLHHAPFILHRYTIWNVVGSPPTNVAVGRARPDKFEVLEGAARILWPGGTTKVPQDTVRGDPKNLSIGWVVESAWATPALRQESRMYAQQAIDEINDDLFTLPNTHLTLEVDERVQGNDKTVEAFNAIEARAKAAGRPVAAMLGSSSSHMASIYDPQATVTVTQQSTGVPVVGYNTGAGVLSNSKKFPNFVRLYPPVSEMQHIFRKTALQFGWDRVGLLGDINDAYSTSFFNVMNGTDPSNPDNLQPPLNAAGGGTFDAQRLNIAHAALLDLGKDTNSTMDALVAKIKAKDVKVFILFGQGAFVDGITEYGYDRGIFGPGFQLMVSDDYNVKSTTTYKTFTALDGAVQILPAATGLEYPGLQRSSAFWKRHPPTQPPAGADTTTPFVVSGKKTRFQDASLYDSIMFAATAIDACLQNGCRAVGYGYEEAMPYFRAASINGVAGASSIKAGSNDPQGRLFLVKVGKDPAGRGLTGPFTFNDVTVTSVTPAELQMCANKKMGEKCSYIAAPPATVKCFASSATSIDVTWEAAISQGDGETLSGYRVTALNVDEQVVVNVNSTAETRVTISVEAADEHQRAKYDIVYHVQVEALYENELILSKAVVCQAGLPCIPPPQPVGGDGGDEDTVVRGRLSSGGAAWNCPCYTSSQVYDIFNGNSYINGNGHLTLKGTPRPLWPAARNGPPGAFYGGDTCMNHDVNLPTTCADDTGKPLAEAPSWCSSAWCWVNPVNCALKNTMGTYFPSPRVTYSYATCGAKNTFSTVCQCRTDDFHTKGMPPSVDDPPLQPDGVIEGPPKDWKCEACMEGAQCTGGTTSTIQVQPGWFVVRRVSKTTGAEKRPKFRRCPGGSQVCPGGALIAQVMRELPPTAVAASRACESITNVTLKIRTGSYETARLRQYPQCQCGPGGTGMLCQACKSSTTVGGKDWVAAGNSSGCQECTMWSADATTLIGAITFGFILLVLGAVLGWWRFTRPSIVEERFVNAFRRINELGANRIVKDFFGVTIGSGITKEIFVDAVIKRCGNGAVTASVLAQSSNLWSKLDEDGDGQVTLDEFVTFVCHLRDGKKSINVQSKYGKLFFAFWGSAMEWWRSMKSQTLRAVIITHFQLYSSIQRSFPELNVQLKTSAATAPVPAIPTPTAGPVGNSTAPVAYFQKALGEATGAVSNLNVAVFEIVGCFLGPRHEARLLYTTATAITLMVVASIVPRIIRGCLRGKRLAQHDSNLIAQFEHFFLKSQLVLVFLVYPALTMTIMRTFVCKEYAQDDQGNPTFWLVDDTVMQCETTTAQRLLLSTTDSVTTTTSTTAAAAAAAAVPSTSPYVFMHSYAWCMVVVVILGFPAFLLYRLW